ncbi:MAG TPA: hypothetical protein VE569_12375, partial [Acidimicrobiia bacterium]|nr:hypothetical protein [Acidimicrobiia bacterium]
FWVGEGPNGSTGTYKVCYRFDPPSIITEASAIGPSGCGDWPTEDDGYLRGVDRALWTDTGVVLLIDLTHNPVDRVTISGQDLNQTITPYALPESGKQFVVVEVPQTAQSVTVEVVDDQGTVLDSLADVDVSTAMRVGTDMGGGAMPDEDLETITGYPPEMAYSGYRIDSTTTPDGAYELGLVVHQIDLPEGEPDTCFTSYAITQGFDVAGGSICGPSPQQAAEIAAFQLVIGGSCGPIPKEDPVVDGIWTLLAVWGVPDTAGAVTVQLADGSTVDVEAHNGVALHLWEESVDIASVEFDGMTQAQRDLVSSYMPARGIGNGCGRGDDGVVG